jgi:hypothetical protein
LAVSIGWLSAAAKQTGAHHPLIGETFIDLDRLLTPASI